MAEVRFKNRFLDRHRPSELRYVLQRSRTQLALRKGTPCPRPLTPPVGRIVAIHKSAGVSFASIPTLCGLRADEDVSLSRRCQSRPAIRDAFTLSTVAVAGCESA